jgi:diguanylate cyclase (GGDEF)-like protein/PAS domain S-box-containing protein
MQRTLRALTEHLWGVSALWLLAFALCLFGWSLLGGSSDDRLAERVAHAGEIASAELAPALLRSEVPALAPQVRALLVRQDVGFAWLRVRDTQGRAVAAAGRLEPGNIARLFYPLISTEHNAPLVQAGVEVGTLEFGLLIGGGGLGSAGSRLVSGLLALLFGVPVLLWLSLRLKDAFLREWSGSDRTIVHASSRGPVLSSAAGELMAVFGRGGVVIDRDQIVRDINQQAENLTGWQREQAHGQPLSTVLVLAQSDAQEPTPLLLKPLLDGTRDRLQGRYRLRTRDGALREVDIDAGPVRDTVGRIGGILLSLSPVSKASSVLQRVMPAQAQTPEQDRHQLSQMLLDQALECVITTDSQDRIQFANGRALENFGYGLPALRGEHISFLLPVPFLRESQARVADFALTLPDMPSAEVMARRRDGSQYRAVLTVHPLSVRGRQGHVVTVRAASAQTSGSRLEPHLHHILDSTPEEAYAIDPDSLQLLAANQAALRNLGCSAQELVQMSLLRLCPRLSPETLRTNISHLREGVIQILEYRSWHLRTNGTSYEVQARLSLWRGEQMPVLLLLAQAVATAAARPELALREDKIEFLRHHDSLTALPSRALLMERLQQAIVANRDSRRPFAVVHLALAGIGEFSRAHGHETGDLLRKAVADRLSATVSDSDTVAREGEHEFILLMTGLQRQNVMPVFKRLHAALSQPLRAGAHEIPLKACLGATLCTDIVTTPDRLLHEADQALREAQARGLGQSRVYQDMSVATPTLVNTEPAELLHEAQVRGQLGIELQVITDVRSRLVVGAEVLLAWRYPGRGLLRTAEQVQQASGNAALVGALSLWVMERACEQQANWHNLELQGLPLLVNLSALQLLRLQDEQSLRGMLTRYHVSPEHLIVMINASGLEALLLDTDSVLPMLRDLGLRLGVNDVDPARADLLRRADVDVVQLTPNTTAGLPDSNDAATQSAAIVQVGQRVGARIFASGVERAEQREALLALGCTIQQGRLLGEPLEPREFARSLVRAEVGAI